MQLLYFLLDKICKILTYNTPFYIPLTLAKLLTLKNGPVFLAHPVYISLILCKLKIVLCNSFISFQPLIVAFQLISYFTLCCTVGVSAQYLRRRIGISLVQESNDGNGWRICWYGVGVFLLNIQRIHGRVSVVSRQLFETGSVYDKCTKLQFVHTLSATCSDYSASKTAKIITKMTFPTHHYIV